MATTRVLRTAPATLTHVWYVGETPTDPTGTPTVAITAADAVAVQSGNATIVGSATGQTTFAMSAVATLEYLTVVWTAIVGGVSRVETDYVEIVGGFLFSLAEGRASDTSLSSIVTYPSAAIEVSRFEVEAEAELICDRAFVPQYARVVMDGTGTSDIVLQHPGPYRSPSDVRTLRAISVAPRADETFVAFTTAERNAVQVTADSRLRRTDGRVWTEGYRNVIVEYEYGLDAPPADLRRAALLRLRSRLNIHRTGVPDRAVSYTVDGGGTYRIDLPGAWKVGIPDVDAVYSRYSRRDGAGTGDDGRPVPASRTLTYQVQRYSLYHG